MGNTGAWLAATTRMDLPEAKARVKNARALRDDAPRTAAALAAGRINAGHAQVITTILRHVAAKLDPAQVAEAEELLLTEARDLSPAKLRKLGKHLEYVLDPDGPEPREREARRNRSFWLRDRGDGTHKVGGILPDIVAAKVKAASSAGGTGMDRAPVHPPATTTGHPYRPARR